ncbi:LysE/ArgO family amino acid transporter [Alteromonas facilis]|uniref:LysE/ArgO family amino acid transporter n=1 Tax=Alteromonas facilis TaxID=2048004 RepID=UPI000C28389D|nr:LysE/ArgO family amino acid transporter [Alteromonas facilis]
MSVAALTQGLGLGFSMIIPIGVQNSYLLNQGIKRNHVFLAASICFACDIVLTIVGVFGGSLIFTQNEFLMKIVGWCGVVFLSGYAFIALRRGFIGAYSLHEQENYSSSKKVVTATTLSVTLLNPHVYLDTVVILGSVGGSFTGSNRLSFAFGAILAACIWFYGIAIGASKLAPWLANPTIQRCIDTFVALMMLVIAFNLYDSVLR